MTTKDLEYHINIVNTAGVRFEIMTVFLQQVVLLTRYGQAVPDAAKKYFIKE